MFQTLWVCIILIHSADGLKAPQLSSSTGNVRRGPLLRSTTTQATTTTSTVPVIALATCQWTSPISYNKLTIGVPKESMPNEKRVAQTPESLSLLIKEGFRALVEAGAGASAECTDAAYSEVGAEIVSSQEVWRADIVVKVQPPSLEEAHLLQNRTLVSFMYPSQHTELMKVLGDSGATVFALDQIPRLLSRGQTFDVLSSQANIAGYRLIIVSLSPSHSPFLSPFHQFC